MQGLRRMEFYVEYSEAHSEPSQTSKMEILLKAVDYSRKSSTLDVRPGSKCVSFVILRRILTHLFRVHPFSTP